jgi:prenyltransferase beta subunit
MRRSCLIVLASFLWLPSVRADDAQDKAATIAYVQKLQTKSGGFLPAAAQDKDPKTVPTLRATSAAVRALHYLGGKVPDLEACKRFVDSCHNVKSGGFADVPGGKPDVFTTAVGAMAIVELKMLPERYQQGAVEFLADNAKSFEEVRIAAAGLEALKRKSPRVKDWKKLAAGELTKAEAKGTPASARLLASVRVTEMRLGVLPEREAQDALVAKLRTGQNEDGSYGKDGAASDLETTYRVMRAFHMLKQLPKNANGVRSFLARCRNADGGYGLTPGDRSSVGGCYFAAIIQDWLGRLQS